MIRLKTLAVSSVRRELGKSRLVEKRLLLPVTRHTAGAAAAAAASAQQPGSQARGYNTASARHTNRHNSSIRPTGCHSASSDGHRWCIVSSSQSLRCCSSSSPFSGALKPSREVCLPDGGGDGVHGLGPARHVATSAAATNKSRQHATPIAFETGKVRRGVGDWSQYGMHCVCS